MEYFDSSAKKHFTEIAIRNSISQQNLLSTPERYPYENTLANDINYLRNLSTIDIEGANANSKKPLGVKYRIKAQEELMRRNAKIITPILYSGSSEEELRRKIAMEKAERMNSRESHAASSQRISNSEKKLPPSMLYHSNVYRQRKEEGMQFDLDQELQKAIATHSKDKDKDKEEEMRPDSNDSDLIPKTIDSKPNLDYAFERSEVNSSGSTPHSNYLPSADTINPEIKLIFEKEKNNIERDLMRKQHRSQHRLLNPTNLSYEGSIVRNSGILASIGKNLANG